MSTVAETSVDTPPAPAASPDPAALRERARRTYELDRAHVFHSWSAQDALDPMVITRAAGSYVWDGEGRRLLDLSSQLVNTNIGHQHPRVVAAIKAQADVLCTIAPQHANEARSEAARLVAGRSVRYPAKLDEGRWYTLVVETVGDEMRVSLDGRPAGFLKSSGIAHATKSKIELGVAGKDGLFYDVKVWNAGPARP